MDFRSSSASLAIAVGAALGVVSGISLAQDAQSDHGQPEPPMMGIHWARGHVPAAQVAGASTSPNLIYHNGPIMHDAVVVPIYWGTAWSNSSFVGDKIAGLETFYSGIGGSSYAGTTNEYSGQAVSITSAISFGGDIADTSATPTNVGSRTSPILNEVCKALGAVHISPVANGYYPVYVDRPRGHASYCAWHSAGTCNGVNVQFAFFFNLDGDPGCDPQDGSGLHSQGMAALANVSGHELSEARTDPRLNAWYDSSGSENSDKCAWVFPTPLLSFTGGSQWKIQPNWSNAAYNGGYGFPNNSGQAGCIDGGNAM